MITERPSELARKLAAKLPIGAVLDDLAEALSTQDAAVLEAPPGSGKTTVVPLALLDQSWLGKGKILMLEPRRIAARAAAHRMAQILGEFPGQTIGYRMRLESRVSEKTRIEVITEGILTRMLQDDPSLTGVSLVIFDEFHERSLDADLALALCLKGRALFRTPAAEERGLKILVMSATLQSDRVSQLLAGAPVIHADGRLHPVDIVYSGASRPNDKTVDRVTNVTLQAIDKHPMSSILVFLPGQGEIGRCRTSLEDAIHKRNITGVTVMPLFGNLSMEEQQAALAPVLTQGHRKVVLATNIAETSLTIEGVDVVIDSGLVREPVYDPATAMTRLTTRKISKSSSTQRAGRAGRLHPGTCYRLWSPGQQDQLAAHGEPEILSADLTSLALQLFQWGIHDPAELDWMDQPPNGAWQQAVALLKRFGALSGEPPTLTGSGEQMAALPVHPRLAHLMMEGARINAVEIATLLAAVLSERDPFGQDDPDLTHRIAILTGDGPCPAQHRGWANRARQLANQYKRQLQRLAITPIEAISNRDAAVGYLITCAYPDRIARRRHGGGYQLANGRSASLPDGHSLTRARWLAVAEVGGVARRKGDSIRSAAFLDEALLDNLLAHQIEESSIVQWDKRDKRFIAERRLTIGALVIRKEELKEVPVEAKRAALIDYIRVEYARGNGLEILPWTKALRQWQARVNLLHQYVPDEGFPPMDDTALLDSLEEWLSPWLDKIRLISDFARLDLANILTSRLSWKQQQQLKSLAPERVKVPSGTSPPIDYTQSPPVLAVKLQEMFGCKQTPTIVQGRVALMIHLLSPAGRPLQVTQDLASFWQTSYHEVRKEMKGRYPKHPWPEDPLTAIPTAKTKRRK